MTPAGRGRVGPSAGGSGLPDVIVRRANVADAVAVAAFAARTFVEAYPAIDAEALRTFAAEHLSAPATVAAIGDPDVVMHLALVDGRYAGYTCLRRGRAAQDPDAVVVELERIYVDAPWHGRGVAARLLSEALEQARRWRGSELRLAVWEHNPRAIRFYEKHAFRAVGEQPFELAGLVQRDIVMTRPVR